jgi:hypothetical protein
MNNENSGQQPQETPVADNSELLIGPDNNSGNDVSTPESTTATPNVSMPEDRPTELSSDFPGAETLGHTGDAPEPEVLSPSNSNDVTPESSTETPEVSLPNDSQPEEAQILSSNESPANLDVGEHPTSLASKIGDKLKDVEEQRQHNVFEYVDIVAGHATSVSVESGWLENPDGTKGDPFARLILNVDHDEIMEFIEKYGTNIKLGLPSGHELSATVSLSGDEFAKNQIIVELPLSGKAADNFFREKETNPIVTQAFDAAYAKEAEEKQNQLNSME